MYSDLDLCFR